MTKYSIVSLAVLCVLASSAQAAGPKTKSSTTTTPTTTSPSSDSTWATSYSPTGGSSKFALGYSATNDNTALGGSAVTAIFTGNSGDMLQFFLAVPNTIGTFNWGIGGLYKHSISEHQGAGFHLGGGLSLGSKAIPEGSANGNFSLSIAAVAGMHFNLPSISSIQIHLDGGPAFTLYSSDPSVSTFTISAISPALGLTVVYSF